MKPARPSTVTLATALQLCVVLLASAGIAFSWVGNMHAAPDDGSLLAAIAVTTFGGLVALWFAATAVSAWRGSNTARVMAVVGAAFYQIAALVMCVCGGLFAFMTLPLRLAPEDPWTAEPRPQPEQQAWEFFATGMTFIVIGIILLAVAVLLLVPPSHRWYAAKNLGPNGSVAV